MQNPIARSITYIVTQYGCNSSSNDMWCPHSKLFTNYNDAYAYFVTVSPSICKEDDDYQETFHYIHDQANNSNSYTIIEDRLQLGEGDWNYAKRPYGAVIAQCIIE